MASASSKAPRDDLPVHSALDHLRDLITDLLKENHDLRRSLHDAQAKLDSLRAQFNVLKDDIAQRDEFDTYLRKEIVLLCSSIKDRSGGATAKEENGTAERPRDARKSKSVFPEEQVPNHVDKQQPSESRRVTIAPESEESAMITPDSNDGHETVFFRLARAEDSQEDHQKSSQSDALQRAFVAIAQDSCSNSDSSVQVLKTVKTGDSENAEVFEARKSALDKSQNELQQHPAFANLSLDDISNGIDSIEADHVALSSHEGSPPRQSRIEGGAARIPLVAQNIQSPSSSLQNGFRNAKQIKRQGAPESNVDHLYASPTWKTGPLSFKPKTSDDRVVHDSVSSAGYASTKTESTVPLDVAGSPLPPSAYSVAPDAGICKSCELRKKVSPQNSVGASGGDRFPRTGIEGRNTDGSTPFVHTDQCSNASTLFQSGANGQCLRKPCPQASLTPELRNSNERLDPASDRENEVQHNREAATGEAAAPSSAKRPEMQAAAVDFVSTRSKETHLLPWKGQKNSMYVDESNNGLLAVKQPAIVSYVNGKVVINAEMKASEPIKVPAEKQDYCYISSTYPDGTFVPYIPVSGVVLHHRPVHWNKSQYGHDSVQLSFAKDVFDSLVSIARRAYRRRHTGAQVTFPGAFIAGNRIRKDVRVDPGCLVDLTAFYGTSSKLPVLDALAATRRDVVGIVFLYIGLSLKKNDLSAAELTFSMHSMVMKRLWRRKKLSPSN